MKSLKIIFIASEVDPFARQGGIADVSRSLPKALKRLGHDVVVITPLYGAIDKEKHNLEQLVKGFPVRVSSKTVLKTDFWRGYLMDDLPVYFIDYHKFFSEKKNRLVYNLRDMSKNGERYYYFCSAVLNLLKFKNIRPDIIHSNDWQTALVPYFVKKRFKQEELFKKTACFFSIHNLMFQGALNWWEIPKEKKDTGHTPLPSFDDKEAVKYINFMKRGIIRSDIVNTVSEQYAKEILTKEFGLQMYRILKNKDKEGRFFGITNGIDYTDYNPETDPGITKNFNVNNFAKNKPKNKVALQKKYGLRVDPRIPLVGTNSRVTEQKGFDLIIKIIDILMERNLQFIIFGDSSEKKYSKFFKKLDDKFPERFVFTKFISKDETQLLAGADILLMPSRFEPCGLGQLKSMRYGAIPIVRATGGLVDTVKDFDPETMRGTGFMFKKYDDKALLIAIIRALETYPRSGNWERLTEQAMTQSFNWEIPAARYITLYKKAIAKVQNK